MNMFKKLTAMLPDNVKNLSPAFLPPPANPRVSILSATFEYIPIHLLCEIPTKTPTPQNQLCLIICTNLALEVWAFHDFKKFSKLFRKSEVGLHMARYLPLLRPQTGFEKVSSLKEYLYNSMPILAVSKQLEEFSTSLGIALFSLKNAQYFHVLRFTEQLANFAVSPYTIVAFLRGGDLRVFDLNTLELKASIRTIFLADSLKMTLAPKSPEKIQFWKETEPVCDITSHLIAYVQHDIVSEGKFMEAARGLVENKIVEKYGFAREAANNLLDIGEKGYNQFMGIFNTRKATLLEKDTSEQVVNLAASKLSTSRIHADEEEEEKVPRKKNLRIIKESGSDDEDGFVDVTASMVKEAGAEPTNKFSIIVRRVADNAILATITPPYFLGISQLKFSPSGNLLLVANENGQHFYVYKLFPESDYRHLSPQAISQQKTAILTYSIFRGYTAAKVSSVAFSFCENWLIINSAKGTSHIYRLDENLPSKVVKNHAKFNYKGHLQKNNVINLSAFARYKYESKSDIENIAPVTSIVSHYPLNMLGTKKEVLLRMGASFFKVTKENEIDDDYTDIPLFITMTKEAEIYTNALLIFKPAAKGTKADSWGAIAEMGREFLMGKTGNYDNDKLVVENIAKFELALENKPERIRTVLDKNVVPVVKEQTGYTDLMKEKVDYTTSSSSPFESQEDNEDRMKMQKWLKEIVAVSCHHTVEGEGLVHCGWEHLLNPDAQQPPIIEDIYEDLLSKEKPYRPLPDHKAKLLAPITVEYNSTELKEEEKSAENKGLTTEAESILRHYRPDESEDNPFDDKDSDEDLEKRITTALKPDNIRQEDNPKIKENAEEVVEESIIENSLYS